MKIIWKIISLLIFYNVIKFTYKYLEIFNLSRFHLTITFTFIIHQIIFWFWNLILIFLDLTHFPNFLHKYKIQKNIEIGWKLHLKCIGYALFGQFFILLPSMISAYPLFEYCGVGPKDWGIPDLLISIKDLIGFIIIIEFGFYYSHRYIDFL